MNNNPAGQSIRKDYMKTAVGLRKLREVSTNSDFSVFLHEWERGNLRKIEMEKEMCFVKETWNAVLEKEDQLVTENVELKSKCNGTRTLYAQAH